MPWKDDAEYKALAAVESHKVVPVKVSLSRTG